MPSSSWIRVADRSALKPGEVLAVEVGNQRIALYNLDGEFFATDNVCTHAFALMSEGFLEGETIECPLHGGRFDVKTGKGLGPPISCDLKTYPVRLSGQDIEVTVLVQD